MIVEAIIDRDGNVDRVRVIKGLPMGLSEEAERAVRKWKFKPGTMNGQAVDVIFNLTVNFKVATSPTAIAFSPAGRGRGSRGRRLWSRCRTC